MIIHSHMYLMVCLIAIFTWTHQGKVRKIMKTAVQLLCVLFFSKHILIVRHLFRNLHMLMLLRILYDFSATLVNTNLVKATAHCHSC